jgi:ribosomal protein L10
MNKAEKQQIVEFLGEQFRSIDSAFLIDYQGLKVVEATDLRRKIREIDGHYVVVKNTLAMLAAKETTLERLESHFQGPTAIAYHSKDVVGLAKLLTEIERDNAEQFAGPPPVTFAESSHGFESSGSRLVPGLKADKKVGKPNDYRNTSIPILIGV